jgi:hypothetical protein
MDSWIRLTTEHEPSYFNSLDMFGETTTVVCDDSPDLTVGMCTLDRMAVHINGNPVVAGYLGKLRVSIGYRNRIRILRDGFHVIQMLNSDSERLNYWFTSIAVDNSVARRVLEARLKGLPVYHQQGNLTTFAISSRAGRPRGILEPVHESEIPKLVAFFNQQARRYQYAPVLTETWMQALNGVKGIGLQDFRVVKESGDIRACLALWDQRKIRQTVVRDYRFPLDFFRTSYNMFARLFRRVVLPSPGAPLNHIFIAFMAINEQWQEQEIVTAIIDDALYEIKTRDADVGLIGLSPLNPLSNSLNAYHKEAYQTCIESVYWTGEEASVINPGPVQPEIAIL